MTIQKTVEGNTLTIALKGWLDMAAAPECKAAIDEIGGDVGDRF